MILINFRNTIFANFSIKFSFKFSIFSEIQRKIFTQTFGQSSENAKFFQKDFLQKNDAKLSRFKTRTFIKFRFKNRVEVVLKMNFQAITHNGYRLAKVV